MKKSLNYKDCTFGNTLEAALCELLDSSSRGVIHHFDHVGCGTIEKASTNEVFDYIVRGDVVTVFTAE